MNSEWTTVDHLAEPCPLASCCGRHILWLYRIKKWYGMPVISQGPDAQMNKYSAKVLLQR